jgi:hypothetical protein
MLEHIKFGFFSEIFFSSDGFFWWEKENEKNNLKLDLSLLALLCLAKHNPEGSTVRDRLRRS